MENLQIPESMQAGLWGLLGGFALVLGAVPVYLISLPPRVVATVMAFGSGVLISAVSFELMAEAYRQGGFESTSIGFLAGAVVYTAANLYISRRGAKHRKRSGSNPSERQQDVSEGAGLAIAVGALLDGIPESVVIGASLLEGSGVSMVTVSAVFLSNVPEGLSSAVGMRKAGRSAWYIFGVWNGIAIVSGLSAFLGNVMLVGAGPYVLSVINAIAAGSILAMIVDTMIPEAFETTHEYGGLITVVGFLVAFVVSKLGS